MAQISIKRLKTKASVKISNLEMQLIQLAQDEIKKGVDLQQLKTSLEKELNEWKTTRIKYKNATTEIDLRRKRTLFIRNSDADLVVFESAY